MKKKGETKMNDEFEVSEPITIPDGKHKAAITSVLLDLHGEYEYIDFYMLLSDVEGATLKYGVPAPKQGKFSSQSKLGQLLLMSGFDFKNGQKLSMATFQDHFIGKELEFKTVSLPKEINGATFEFSEIVEGTIKFIQETL